MMVCLLAMLRRHPQPPTHPATSVSYTHKDTEEQPTFRGTGGMASVQLRVQHASILAGETLRGEYVARVAVAAAMETDARRVHRVLLTVKPGGNRAFVALFV